MGAIGEVDDYLDAVEMPRPVCLRADSADRTKLYSRNGIHLPPGSSEDGMAAIEEAAA